MGHKMFWKWDDSLVKNFQCQLLHNLLFFSQSEGQVFKRGEMILEMNRYRSATPNVIIIEKIPAATHILNGINCER